MGHYYLRVYISTYKFDVICISETYLDSDTSDDDKNLKVVGYNLIRIDHPSNTIRGDICIYYKHSLPFRLLNIHYLRECMNLKYCSEVKYVTLYHYITHLANLLHFQRFSNLV